MSQFNKTGQQLKSVNGRKCLSKCYGKGVSYLHPIFMNSIVSNTNNNSCAIYPIYSKDADFLGMHVSDTCRIEDNKNFKPPDELESMLLSFYFNSYDFLSTIYDLNSFDEVIHWTINNSFLPFDTIRRVHNCAWKAFGSKTDELSSNVLDYYYDIAKSHWLKDYAKTITKNYSFELITKKDITNSLTETEEILESKFFSYNFFLASLRSYINENQDEWDTIPSHYGAIKNYLFQKLVEKLNK